MAREPSMNQGGLVSAVVVEDQVEVEVGRHGGVDGIEELPELHGSVSTVALSDDRACLNIQRSKQRRGPVATIVVSAPFDLPRPHRQKRLRAIEGLDLRLLIDREHQSPVWGIEIKSYNV